MPIPQQMAQQHEWLGRVRRGTELDPVIELCFVCEVLAIGVAVARAFDVRATDRCIDFSFRWTGLAGRVLTSRIKPGMYCLEGLDASDDVVESGCFVPLSITPAELAALVHKTSAPLLRAFRGFEFQLGNVEQIVRDFLKGAI